MRIGIDAKWLFRGPPSGRRVVRSLLEGLLEVAAGDEVHVFLDARSRREPFGLPIPVQRRHFVWAGNNQLSNLLVIPPAADRLQLDAVVYQNFVPPRWHARHARIAFVHDVIFESHPSFFTWRERLYFKPLRRLTRSADRVCTVSGSERDRMTRFGYGAPERIDVVPNAVDPSFVPRERFPAGVVDQVLGSLGITAPFVLYVGRLNVRKNVATLVRAMGLVRAAGLLLVVAGPPDSTTGDLVAIAASAGVADRVRLFEAPTDAELHALYATAMLFCFPSFDESFGLPPLEAMAAGTPVVVSNIPALVETCGNAVLYVDPADAPAIAATIDALAGDAPRRAALTRAGLERAGAFTCQRSARHLMASVRAAVRSRT